MNTLPLSEDEVWLLRCIDKHCRVPGQGCMVRIHRTHPRKGVVHPGGKEILDRMDFKDFQMRAGGLEQYDFIGTSFDGSGGGVWITPKGKTYIYEIDHPDLVEKARQWARHHPVWSWVIIVYMVVGPLVALVMSGACLFFK